MSFKDPLCFASRMHLLSQLGMIVHPVFLPPLLCPMPSHSVFMVLCVQHLLLVAGLGLFSVLVVRLLLLMRFDSLVDVFCVDMLWFEEFSCYGQLGFGGSSQQSLRWTQIHMYSVAAFHAASIAK